MGDIVVSQEVWGELMGILKDVAVLLEKEDATQAQATMDKPPKAKETAEPIVGGAAPSGKPGTGIAKDAMISMGGNPKKEQQTQVKEEGKSILKEEVSGDDSESDKDEDDDDGKSESTESTDMKSLLKDLRTALNKSADVDAKIDAAVKKAVPAATERLLRKMGYHPTRPDIVKIGLDTNADVKKSDVSDSETEKVVSKDDLLKKSIEDKTRRDWYGNDNELGKFADGTSFQELGAMREKLGGFNPF